MSMLDSFFTKGFIGSQWNGLIYDNRDSHLQLSRKILDDCRGFMDAKRNLAVVGLDEEQGRFTARSTSILSPRTSLCPPWSFLLCDGAVCRASGKAGGGGLLCDDHRGNFLSAFTFNCGVCDALSAELWAIFHGLKLAKSSQITNLAVFSDSSVAVSLLSDEPPKHHGNYHLILNCRKLARDLSWSVDVNHIPRTMNTAADFLAKNALMNVEEFSILRVSSPSLDILIDADISAIGSAM